MPPEGSLLRDFFFPVGRNRQEPPTRGPDADLSCAKAKMGVRGGRNQQEPPAGSHLRILVAGNVHSKQRWLIINIGKTGLKLSNKVGNDISGSNVGEIGVGENDYMKCFVHEILGKSAVELDLITEPFENVEIVLEQILTEIDLLGSEKTVAFVLLAVDPTCHTVISVLVCLE